MDGTPYYLPDDEAFGVRVAVTWNVHWTCNDNLLNEVKMNFVS